MGWIIILMIAVLVRGGTDVGGGAKGGCKRERGEGSYPDNNQLRIGLLVGT